LIGVAHAKLLAALDVAGALRFVINREVDPVAEQIAAEAAPIAEEGVGKALLIPRSRRRHGGKNDRHERQ